MLIVPENTFWQNFVVNVHFNRNNSFLWNLNHFSYDQDKQVAIVPTVTNCERGLEMNPRCQPNFEKDKKHTTSFVQNNFNRCTKKYQ